MGDECNNWPQR